MPVESTTGQPVGIAIQAFVIYRHGARYPLKQPEHNILWPSEKSFWDVHVGRLTPVGVLQMSHMGIFFRSRYNWVDTTCVKVYSTHRSRALESAWSLLLGLLPGASIKFYPNRITTCACSEPESSDKLSDRTDICHISYYHKREDPLFGREDPSFAYKININDSSLLKDYQDRADVTELINRLSKNGYFRLRRDSITTVAKLKDIYSQIQIDEQLKIPHDRTLAAHYGLTESELTLITTIGCEVMHRRLIPSTDSIADNLYNTDQGMGIIKNIYDKLESWTGGNELNLYSCHDTNLIAVMSVLGIKIIPPSFCGYILVERIYNSPDDIVAIYYCSDPFDVTHEAEAKIWPNIESRKEYLEWNSLTTGAFLTEAFKTALKVSLS
jgi:hypothetical protein